MEEEFLDGLGATMDPEVTLGLPQQCLGGIASRMRSTHGMQQDRGVDEGSDHEKRSASSDSIAARVAAHAVSSRSCGSSAALASNRRTESTRTSYPTG